MGRHRPKEPTLTKLQLLLGFSLVSTAPWTTLWSAPQLPPIVVDPSASILRKGTQHLEQAIYVSNSSLSVIEVAETLDTLMPVITVLASFITTPLQRDSVNLRRAAEVTLESSRQSHVDLDDLVSHEEDLAYRGHRPVAASAYWSLLFLDFFEHILEGVIKKSSITLDPSPNKEKEANAAIRQAGRDAYDKTYAHHHNRVVRAIARKVFDFLPPREVFYRALGDAGADRHRWGKHLRRDFEGFLKASRPFVKRMRGHFAEAPAPTF